MKPKNIMEDQFQSVNAGFLANNVMNRDERRTRCEERCGNMRPLFSEDVSYPQFSLGGKTKGNSSSGNTDTDPNQGVGPLTQATAPLLNPDQGSGDAHNYPYPSGYDD